MGFKLELGELWPGDPAYAPFGRAWLRGLAPLPVAIGAAMAVLWGAQDFLERMTTPGFRPPNVATALGWHAWDAVLVFVSLVPLLLLVSATFDVRASRIVAAAVAFCAVALGAAVSAAAYPLLSCSLHPVADPICATLGWLPHWYHLQLFARIALWGGLLAMVLHLVWRQQEAIHSRHAEQVRALRARQEEAEARLQSLQAQIEPHFLFNTLAHIQRFQATDPAQGQAMLRSLVEYMEAALPRMRDPLCTLGGELALVHAYMRVQQVRMGERLRFCDEVPAGVLDVLVPPVSVLTLAENAIKHGLGPKGGGGTLTVAAREDGGELLIDVIDDGMGLRAASGRGRGLANTRARLQTMFGPGASLAVAGAESGGVRASMRLPIRRQAGA
jgi:hypothetical protein